MPAEEDIDQIKVLLGKRIRSLRHSQNLSQEKLGMMIGMDRSYLVTIEHGKRNVSLEILVRIARGLGISLSELLAGIA